MNVVFALLAVLAGFGAFRISQDYLRGSSRSFASAERAWTGVTDAASKLIDQDIPESVGRVAVALMATAGCGCYVRGMLKKHYLPRVQFRKPPRIAALDEAFRDVEKMSNEQRDLFSDLVANVIVYDSFRNPLQGWLFRRLLRAYVKPQPPLTAKYEANMTAMDVLSQKGAIAI